MGELPKPPGLGPEYGEQFMDGAMVRSYRYRAPYPVETFEILAELTGPLPAVLDLGCGTGDLTLGLRKFAGSIDAIDLSPEMIAAAKARCPEGVRWIVGPVETAPVGRDYDLITAGESLHWMDWPRLFSRLASLCSVNGVFAIVARAYERTEWWTDAFQAIVDRYSTNKDYKRYDLLAELRQRRLLTVIGTRRTRPTAFVQSVADLVEAFHSRNGFSRDRMTAEAARAFESEATTHLERFAEDGVMNLGVTATVTWGR